MRHRIKGRKLGRTTAHRKAMLRNLVTSLLDNEYCITTLEKAKEVRPLAEKMITLGKRETLHARRQALKVVRSRIVVKKVFDALSARYASRPGGYTRIYKLNPRPGDGADMALIELVDRPEKEDKKDKKKDKKVKKEKKKEKKDTKKEVKKEAKMEVKKEEKEEKKD
ncbi:50S ribosomal protein L17 [Acidobacteriota bacterium]